jgi:hypothetical protein
MYESRTVRPVEIILRRREEGLGGKMIEVKNLAVEIDCIHV